MEGCRFFLLHKTFLLFGVDVERTTSLVKATCTTSSLMM